MSREDMVKSVHTMYPTAQNILEIDCREGERVLVGRRKGDNVFGVDGNMFKKIWKEKKIDLYCQPADYSQLPFGDDTFDYVLTAEKITLSDEELKDIRRVGCNNFYFKFDLFLCDTNHWIDKLLEFGYSPEIATVSSQGTLVVEARKC